MNKPDIKLYDDRIEIRGIVKGDVNSGINNIDFDTSIKVTSDFNVDANANIKGDVNVDANANIKGVLNFGSAKLYTLGDQINLGGDHIDHIYLPSVTHTGHLMAKNLEVEPGLDGEVRISFYTKWNPEADGYLAKNLYLKPDSIVFTTDSANKGKSSFDLLKEFNALLARVEILEISLKAQIRKEAYRRWLANGSQSDNALEDWLEAEKEILSA